MTDVIWIDSQMTSVGNNEANDRTETKCLSLHMSSRSPTLPAFLFFFFGGTYTSYQTRLAPLTTHILCTRISNPVGLTRTNGDVSQSALCLAIFGIMTCRPPPLLPDPVVRGSLEGVGGVLTSEVCHKKAVISLIRETYFLGNLSAPFFIKLYFVRFVTFRTLLALLTTV